MKKMLFNRNPFWRRWWQGVHCVSEKNNYSLI